MRTRGGRLDYRTSRSQIAAEDGDAGPLLDRFFAAMNYFCVPAWGIGSVLAHRLAVYGQRVAVDQVAQSANHGGDAASVVEIFHEELAGRHQVHQEWKGVSETIKIVELKLDANPARQRQQMQNGVG